MTKLKCCFILVLLILPGLGVSVFAAHWAWVERQVAPVPWDYTAFPMFMVFDKSDHKLTLVINDSYAGTVQVWKFIGGGWNKVWDGMPDLGEVAAYYHFRYVYNIYFDENLKTIVMWGLCPGYQFETACQALFKYNPNEGFVKITDCIPVSVYADAYPNLSVAFDTKRKRAVIVGGIRIYLDGVLRHVTIEFDGNSIYYIPNPGTPPLDDIFFSAGTCGYDPISDRVVFYGQRFPGLPLETWEYYGQTWTLIPTAISPPMDIYPVIGMNYVPELGGLLSLPNDYGPIDSWLYRKHAWQKLSVSGQFAGCPWAVMAFDNVRQMPVFYGGVNEVGFINQMWEFQCAVHCKPVSKP